MKKILHSKLGLTALLLCCLPGRTPAQLHITGGTLIINPGAILHSNRNVTNTNGGILTNEGTLDISGNMHNTANATTQGNGRYVLSGNWTNSAYFVAGASAVTFKGAENSAITSGGAPFYTVETAKTNADLLLTDGTTILFALYFTADNNRVDVMANDLILGPDGQILNFDENNYILTGGSGKLVKSGLGQTPFTFPVGYDAATYNPVVLSQHGGTEQVGVRCLEHFFDAGSGGVPVASNAADVSWEVTETLPGDNDMEMTVFWNVADELPSFNRSACFIGRWNGSAWDFGASPGSPANGAAPFYSAHLSSFTDPGFFGVGSLPAAGLKNEPPNTLVELPDLVVYPNPFSTRLTVRNAKQEIQILDMMGRLIFQNDLGEGNDPLPVVEMDLRHLPAGAYLLKTAGPDGRPVSLRVVRAGE